MYPWRLATNEQNQKMAAADNRKKSLYTPAAFTYGWAEDVNLPYRIDHRHPKEPQYGEPPAIKDSDANEEFIIAKWPDGDSSATTMAVGKSRHMMGMGKRQGESVELLHEEHVHTKHKVSVHRSASIKSYCSRRGSKAVKY